MAMLKHAFCIIAVFCAWLGYEISKIDFTVPKEFLFSTEDFIQNFGYRYEKYVIESKDGFISSIYRLLPPKVGIGRKKSVIFFGGVFCSSDLFVTQGPGRDLAFMLVDSGFDVWLGNQRGSRYTVPGPNANHSSPDLLSYGFHEIGVYDFAKTIDFVLSKTASNKTNVLGTSAGSGAILALLSTKPEYNDKIELAIHFGSGISLQLYQWSWLLELTGALNPSEIRPIAMLLFCDRLPSRRLCSKFVAESVGFPDVENATFSALWATLIPSGLPWGVVDHMLQLSSDDADFRTRDFGEDENLRIYKTKKPPLYDLSKVTAPSKLYYAEKDTLIRNEFTRKIFKKLPTKVEEYRIASPFSHSNFLINTGRSPSLVKDIIKNLRS